MLSRAPVPARCGRRSQVRTPRPRGPSASIPVVAQPSPSEPVVALTRAPGPVAPGLRSSQVVQSVARLPWLLPAALLILAAGLRFRGLDAQSLWLDEAMSVYFVNLGLEKLWEITFVLEPNPPLYYLLLWVWVQLWGQGEIAIRSLSALLGTLSVLPAYLLGRDLGGSRAGALAGFAALASPFLLWYSQEARSFALLAATSAWLLYLTHRASESSRARLLLLWTLAASLTLYSHVYGAFAFGAAALTLVLTGRGSLPQRLFAGVIPTATFAPWIIATLLQSVAARGWRAPVGPDELVARALMTVTHHDVLAGPLGWSAVALLCLAAAIGLMSAPPRTRLLLGLAVALPLLSAYAFSFFKPIFAERYIIPIAIPLYVAASLGVVAAGRRLPPLPALAALGLIALLGASLVAFEQPRFEKENFRAAADRVAQSTGPDDTVLFVAEFAQRPFEYYYAGPGRLVGFFGDHRNPAAFLDAIVTKSSTVWLVESHTERYDPDHQVRQWLADRYPLVTEAYPQGINLRAFRTHYAQPPSAVLTQQLATFAELSLMRAEFPATTPARDTQLHPPSAWLPVTLVWSASTRPPGNYRLVLELVDGRGVWGRSLHRSGDLFSKVPTSTWQAGAMMIESADLNLNPETPPGRYVLQLAVLDAEGIPVPAAAPGGLGALLPIEGALQLGEVEVRA